MTLLELVEKIGGTLDGDGSLEITGVNGVKDANQQELSFIANPKYASAASSTRAGALVVPEDWALVCPVALIRVKDPDATFAQAAMLFYTPVPAPVPGVHPTAVVADDVELGAGVSVGPQCVIESGVKIGLNTVISAQCYIGHQVRIGQDSWIHPQVSIRESAVIGSRTIIHNGSVVGSDGFGYSVDETGVRTKIDQIGIVQIGDDVEIGANVTIDRARFGKTSIGDGTKIDNLVQIAHNVIIGKNSVIIAQVAIAGSTTLGDQVIMAGQSAAAGHLHIGDRAMIAGKAGVTKDVDAGEYMMGMPAMPAAKFKRFFAAPLLIPKLKKRIADLEEKMCRLEEDS